MQRRAAAAGNAGHQLAVQGGLQGPGNCQAGIGRSERLPFGFMPHSQSADRPRVCIPPTFCPCSTPSWRPTSSSAPPKSGTASPATGRAARTCARCGERCRAAAGAATGVWGGKAATAMPSLALACAQPATQTGSGGPPAVCLFGVLARCSWQLVEWRATFLFAAPLQVGLLVIDEIHLLGADRGPILEVIVSRMRYIAAQVLHLPGCVGGRHKVPNFFVRSAPCLSGEGCRRLHPFRHAPGPCWWPLPPPVCAMILQPPLTSHAIACRPSAPSALWACPPRWPTLRTWRTGWASQDR
jgi:hypothetical protein